MSSAVLSIPASRSTTPDIEDEGGWVAVAGELPLHRRPQAMSGVETRSARRRHAAEQAEHAEPAALPPVLPSPSEADPQDQIDDSKKRRGDALKWEKLIPEEVGGHLRKASTARRRYREGALGWWDLALENSDLLPLLVYTVLALFTRLWQIGKSDTVVWDEAHFGKFGAYYINRTFYFDVHPPLGKMLVGFAGAVTGFNGSFDYPSGAQYPEFVPYRAMRILMALPGVGMVPLAWGTAVELGLTGWGRHIVTLMVLCDVALLVICRFVLLDSLLLFFTFCTVYCLACFHNEQRRPFTLDWWVWLSLTGFSIGCVMSVKWVGFFVMALVGLYTIEDLWDKFGDLTMPYRTYARHWASRALCLLVIPVMVYMTCFKLHFMILNHSGTGDAQMSSLFQAHLIGNDFGANPLEPVFGSKITLKNVGYGGGLLHSHVQTYPTGSQQQQVTCYHYKDTNNDWIITPTWDEGNLDEGAPLRYLKDGDVVRFVHNMTGRNLHSHAVVAPVSKLNNEISCYGNDTIGDSNDHWTIEVVDDLMRGKKRNFQRIHSLTTRLRIKHTLSGCYMRAANSVLPQWGFKQVEVSCDKNNNPKDEHTYWNIESHWNDRLPPGNAKLYRSPFLRDFWHLNVAMWTSNNALVPDPDKDDVIASKPFDWPLLHLGMRMNGWSDSSIKYYLIGNPIVWWSGASSLIIFAGSVLWYLMRFQRKITTDWAPGEWERFLYVGKVAAGGWLLEYVPYLIMGRVTYLHHYLPTVYFAILCAGFMLDHFVFAPRVKLAPFTKNAAGFFVTGSVVATFLLFRNAAFGFEGPIEEHRWLTWRKTWNIQNAAS